MTPILVGFVCTRLLKSKIRWRRIRGIICVNGFIAFFKLNLTEIEKEHEKRHGTNYKFRNQYSRNVISLLLRKASHTAQFGNQPYGTLLNATT